METGLKKVNGPINKQLSCFSDLGLSGYKTDAVFQKRSKDAQEKDIRFTFQKAMEWTGGAGSEGIFEETFPVKERPEWMRARAGLKPEQECQIENTLRLSKERLLFEKIIAREGKGLLLSKRETEQSLSSTLRRQRVRGSQGWRELLEKYWRTFGHLDSVRGWREVRGHVCCNWLYSKEKQTARMCMTGDSATSWSRTPPPTAVSLLPSHRRTWGAISRTITLQRDCFQVLEKDTPGL